MPKRLPCGRSAPTLHPLPADFYKGALAQLQSYCAEKKINRSDAREKILETIVKESRHFTTLELLVRLQKRYPDIGKATVYRNLPILVESGVLKEGPHDSQGQVLYELAGEEHHDHIVCINCHAIIEFHDSTIEKRQEKLARELNFKPRDHHHVIYAACGLYQK